MRKTRIHYDRVSRYGLRTTVTAAFAVLALALATDLLSSRTAASRAQKNTVVSTAPLLKRTTTRRENRRFGFGGTVTIVGAPAGSVTVEGWNRSEVELVAEIELNAPSEQDLDQLADINSFAFDEDANHLSVLTTGTHDKVFLRRVARNFPKQLLGLPWKIDYRLHVPTVTDLEVNAGRGAVKVSGVEGAIRLNATEGDTTLVLSGGVVSATITSGNAVLSIPARSWRGGGADVRIAAGDLTLELLPGFNGDIDVDILRSGKILDSYGLAAREKPGLTDTVMRARAGVGGAYFKFTLGDGTFCVKKKVIVDG